MTSSHATVTTAELLAAIAQNLQRLSRGESPLPLPAGELEDETARSALQAFEEFSGDFSRERFREQELEFADRIRSTIWKLAADPKLKEQELIGRLLETVGQAYGLARATFLRLDAQRKVLTTEIQWLGKGQSASLGMEFPLRLVTMAAGKSWVLLPAADKKIPSESRIFAEQLFERWGLRSMLIVPYGDKQHCQGYFSIGDSRPPHEWTTRQIELFLEVSRILHLRAEQLQVHGELKALTRDLELKVSKQTHYLEAANEQLRDDIKEQQMAEGRLRSSEERFRAVAEHANEAIIITDSLATVSFWNRAAQRMFGHSQESMKGESCTFVLSPGTAERMLQRIQSGVQNSATDSPLPAFEGEGVREDGTLIPIELSTSSWYSDGRRFFTIIIRDISERLKHSRELAREQLLRAATIEALTEAVITTDEQGSILLLNKAALKLLGCSRERACGSKFDAVVRFESVRGDLLENPLVAQVIEQHCESTLENVRLRSAGAPPRDVVVSAVPLGDAGSLSGVVIALSDVTEKARVERELFKVRKLESIGVLAGGIAHDFNNILTGIMTNLFMAKMEVGRAGTAYSLLADAENAAFKARNLTNQLLTFAKGGTPVKESASLRELIEDSAGFTLSGSNVDCHISLPDDLWAVDIDRGQIDQVLNNLIINADQSMAEGGSITILGSNMEISDTVSDSTEALLPLKPGRYVKIVVEDEGCGIAQEHLERVFDPYFTTKKEGSGLGLSTVYSIIQKHNGFITLRSRPEQGTSVIFYLPAATNALPQHKPSLDQIVKGSGRILLMDDDEIVRAVVERLLRSTGYQVSAVYNGEEAIVTYHEALERGEGFDVVVMDLTIPGGMGGKETIGRLKALDPGVRAVVTSGYSNDPILANYREHGFLGVIKKPFRIEEFTRVIAQAILENGAEAG